MMKEEDPETSHRPGLPEAVNPEIGNHSAWEMDPHNLNLRLPDPSKWVDDLLLSGTDRSGVILKWESPLTDPNALPGLPEEIIEPDTIEKPTGRKQGKVKKIFSASKEKGQLPDWIEKMGDELVLKDDPNGPADLPLEERSLPDTEPVKEVVPEGKRVKKAVKKAKKELEKSNPKKTIATPAVKESTLSPFTSWLKSLRGSEYVHPYEDDYGLGQQREGISETLADLLAAQGYKEQAVEMYSELMAKYPEKSSFFAAKIEALK